MNTMQFAGTIGSEEMMSGLLGDGRKIYVPWSVYEYHQNDDPLYWLIRYETGDFEDIDGISSVWIEEAQNA